MYLIENLSYIIENERYLNIGDDDNDDESQAVNVPAPLEGIKRVVLYNKLKELKLDIKKLLITQTDDKVRLELYKIYDLLNLILYYYNTIPYDSALVVSDSIISVIQELLQEDGK
ncbi:MAG: hypothetical protein QXD03_03645 [Candidatus Anstonellales archaeon]